MVATLENQVADKVLATIGAVLWSIQVIPQIIKSYRTKSTEGLSAKLMFIWASATIFQGSYLVSMRSSIPLQVQPQAFGAFGVVSWAQCLYYGNNVPLKRVLVYVAIFFTIFVGFEVGSVYALWAGERRGVEWPKQMYGWITSALLIIGLLPQYYEIYKQRRVVGISILFMLVDIGGGIFSGVSLFFRKEFDSTAFVQYMLVVVLDGVVVLLKPILDYRYKRRAAAGDEEADKDDEEGRVGSPVGRVGSRVATLAHFHDPSADNGDLGHARTRSRSRSMGTTGDTDDRTQNGEDATTTKSGESKSVSGKSGTSPIGGRTLTQCSEWTAVSDAVEKH